MSNRPTTSSSRSERVRQARAASEARTRTGWIIGAALLVVLLAAGIALLATRSSGDDVAGGGASPSGGTVVPSGDRSTGPVQVSGSALPTFSQATPDPAVGQRAPALVGESFDGEAVRIDPGDGRPKIVMFLAHWCPHCQKEVPRLTGWLEANGMPTDVDLYAVSTAVAPDRGNYPPGAWLRREAWPVPTMLDDQEQAAASAYGLSSFPYFVVIGADGRVVGRTSGELSTSQWEALLQEARTGSGTSPDGAGPASPAGG